MDKMIDRRIQRLCRRRAVTLELPEFLLQTYETRAAEANDGAAEEERLTVETLVELQLAEGLHVVQCGADIARLEPRIPGLTAAVSHWLAAID